MIRVQLSNCLVDSLRRVWMLFRESLQKTIDDHLVAVSGVDPFDICGIWHRQAGQAVREKAQGWAVGVSSRPVKDDGQRTRRKRVDIIDVSNPKGGIIPINLNLAGSQNAAILIAEDRYQYLVLK